MCFSHWFPALLHIGITLGTRKPNWKRTPGLYPRLSKSQLLKVGPRQGYSVLRAPQVFAICQFGTTELSGSIFGGERDCVASIDQMRGIDIFKELLTFGCAGSLRPRGLFSSCGEQGLLSSCGVRASHCCSCCGTWALGHAGFSRFGPRTLEHRLSSCDAQA